MNLDERMKMTAELETLLADFWYDVDTNWGRQAANFYTEDGIFEASGRTYVGRDMIDRFYRYRQDRGARVAVHAFSNFRAEPMNATEALSTWYLFLYAADGEPVLPTKPPIQIALATDHCVKCEDGRWRYRRRKFSVWFKGGVPTTTMPGEYEAQCGGNAEAGEA
jgi:SnoaL-like domain